jgi:hypothetical protein
MVENAESAAARQLAKFLTTPQGPGYGGRKTPLEERIEQHIRVMAYDIATEVITNTPELRETIRRMTVSVIHQAMSKDSYLSDTVVQAVAKSLGQLALERAEDEGV